MVSKKKYLARYRKYSRKHPVVHLRVPSEEYDRLKSEAEAAGKSLPEYCWNLAWNASTRKDKVPAKIQVAYKEGYDEGYAKAEHQYRVDLKCEDCGRKITVKRKRKSYKRIMGQLDFVKCSDCY